MGTPPQQKPQRVSTRIYKSLGALLAKSNNKSTREVRAAGGRNAQLTFKTSLPVDIDDDGSWFVTGSLHRLKPGV